MLSANQIKYLKSLHQKKNRDLNKVFFAEGDKLLRDLLDSDFELIHLYQLENTFSEGERISEKAMSRISALKNYSNSFGVFKKKNWQLDKSAKVVLALDGVQDPGNFGTIIRLMDWFGIDQLICSENTVEVYNPKVIQSTMGSLRNISVVYGDLKELIVNEFPAHQKVGTFMNGENVKAFEWSDKTILIMGSEGKGISAELIDLIEEKITIPQNKGSKAESLNVAISTGIILSMI